MTTQSQGNCSQAHQLGETTGGGAGEGPSGRDWVLWGLA